MGSPQQPVEPDHTAEISLLTTGQPIDLAWDPNQLSRGILNRGRLHIYGTPPDHAGVVVGGQVEPNPLGPAELRVVKFNGSGPVQGWSPGDELVLAATRFHHEKALQDERFRVQSVPSQGRIIAPTAAFANRHVVPETSLDLHAVNLSRNVRVVSEAPETVADRGHVMSPSSDVVLVGVLFKDLGRTDKRIPLDDREVRLFLDGVPLADPCSIDRRSPPPGFTYELHIPALGEIFNRRGRYAVHFHRNHEFEGVLPTDLTTPARVEDCVVWGSPGWGFVNHSSDVEFRRCVAYDFAGAGFVTEAGDEVGLFEDNVALHGTGVRVDARGVPTEDPADTIYFPHLQTVFSCDRPQPLADFGFGGDGFWFQGPLVHVRNNVASACAGAGMFWFGCGAADRISPFSGPSGVRDEYVGFPASRLAAAYTGAQSQPPLDQRHWIRADGTADEVVIADLPLVELSAFDGYGCSHGMHIRFQNWYAISPFSESPFFYDERIQQRTNGCATTPGVETGLDCMSFQVIDDVRLWNVSHALRAEYLSRTRWNGLTCINRVGHSKPTRAQIGLRYNATVSELEFTDLSIDGWALAGLVQDRALSICTLPWQDNSGRLTFNGGITLGEYAIADRRCSGEDLLATIRGASVVVTYDAVTESADVEWTSIALADIDCQGCAARQCDSVAPRCVAECLACAEDLGTCSSHPGDPNLVPLRTLVRYKPADANTWEFQFTSVGPPSLPGGRHQATLSGLVPGMSYEVQLLQDNTTYYSSGRPPCPGRMPRWSAPVVFDTL